MDQDSGRGSGRQAPSRDGRPRHQLDEKSPSGAPNPLPRRSAQGHMEPQLRRSGGSGTGTPFTAFVAADKAAAGKAAADEAAAADDAAAATAAAGNAAADVAAADEAAKAEAGGSGSRTVDGSTDVAEASRAADFRKGVRRGQRPDPAVK